jgi:outer membrane receptor protein involved in Fe transport
LGRFNINQPHGQIFYSIGDSALDARSYSVTGQSLPKPSYAQHRVGATLGGPFSIPKLYKGNSNTFFFINYFATLASNPYDVFSTVPTLAERSGDFSAATTATGAPVQIFDPATGQPFPNSVIPTSRINSAAAGLLSYVPLPNLPGSVQNFHFVTSAENNSSNVNARVVHTFGSSSSSGRATPLGRFRASNVNFGFNYRTTSSDLTNPFPGIGGSSKSRAINVPIGFTRSWGKLNNSIRFNFNRSRTESSNLFAGVADVEGALGIGGVSTNPFDWGLPGISFTHFTGLNDVTPLLRRDQTISIGDNAVWSRAKHNVRFGGDYRRVQINPRTDANARGTFIFTGFATAGYVNGVVQPATGFDLADFLLGLPQQASTQYGVNSYYFRENVWDAYVQDDWRMRGSLTLNFGVRYEYYAPFTEKYGRIVNLDVAPGFTSIAPVCASVTALATGACNVGTGPYSGSFPAGLVNPDRNNFAPRLGIAWKPLNNTVVRAGYGINYNTGAYASIVQQMAFQPPFAFTDTSLATPTGLLTLQNAFPTVSPSVITNNYGVDRNYRMGYVQNWNIDVQREIKSSIVLNLSYNGAKGTRLDMLRAPNRTVTGLLIANAEPFLWQTSDADSTLHSGSVRVRKRMRGGLSFGGTYTFSKSIDNASTIGGGATVVAQNDQDLRAERGLSSFDQRHRLTADYTFELPFGPNRRWFAAGGWASRLLGDWMWSGSISAASGLPFTPRVLGAFTDVSRGTNGTLRADLTGQPLAINDPALDYCPGPSTAPCWFNTLAFVAPPPGQYGDARRNSITGPSMIDVGMAVSKTIRIRETQSLELRAQASNVFNTPYFNAIDTTVNSPSFGRVISASSMRQVQMLARFRF